MGRALAHFDMAELTALNAKTLHAMPYELVAARLTALGVGAGSLGGGEAQCHAPGRCRRSGAAGDGPGDAGDRGCRVRRQAPLALLPPEPWDEATWGAWTKAVAAETGAKGRALFHPLRLALTGLEHGPELKKLLPLIGRAKSSGAPGRKNRVTCSFVIIRISICG